ncbi:MAG: ABC-F family ATP-binding cassette domain-containing protein [Kofleriaceae bacterium]|nr:ABC-F family ATP-binding cassette domain-containing protein [Kofleriaceae bacterium]
MTADKTHEKALRNAGLLIRCAGLSVAVSSGRRLISGLNMELAVGDKVAIVGRNGVGKSTLLSVLSGQKEPEAGSFKRVGSVFFVAQNLSDDANSEDCHMSEDRYGSGESFGERRRRNLMAAQQSNSELLLLDEPSQDLDEIALQWLVGWIRQWQGGMLVVTHDRLLLAEFRHFFVVAESGCRLVSGRYSEVEKTIEREEVAEKKKYRRKLQDLNRTEARNSIVGRRRRRKQMGGRMREIDRAPSRAMLNSKRSYAQESQGKRRKLQKARIGDARAAVKEQRSVLRVQMHLSQAAPEQQEMASDYAVELQGVGVRMSGRMLFEDVSYKIGQNRIAVTGANGSGKTCLLQVIGGARKPDVGRAYVRHTKIGCISQGGVNWMSGGSLLDSLQLLSSSKNWEARLKVHRFPFALAVREMHSLSPGERTRAALIALLEQPGIELLILDEPTCGLDFSGRAALASLLRVWRGGLVIASHDRQFLDAIDAEEEIAL